jgi:hypothetical protein
MGALILLSLSVREQCGGHDDSLLDAAAEIEGPVNILVTAYRGRCSV